MCNDCHAAKTNIPRRLVTACTINIGGYHFFTATSLDLLTLVFLKHYELIASRK
jgi:hypothetical protein